MSLPIKKRNQLQKDLENLYAKYHKRDYLSPDPLESLYYYKKKQDIEIIGLAVSCISYGNVLQILKSAKKIRAILGKSPHFYLQNSNDIQIEKDFSEFQHRWHRGTDLSSLCIGLKRVYEHHDSLEDLLEKYYSQNNKNLLSSIDNFVEAIKRLSPKMMRKNLLCQPIDGSACKRLFMFMRWMIRHDELDLGLWTKISKSQLILPVDTHLYQIAKKLCFTKRKQNNLKTVLEITQVFREIYPEDPARYDFVLTRFGIRNEMKKEDLYQKLQR